MPPLRHSFATVLLLSICCASTAALAQPAEDESPLAALRTLLDAIETGRPELVERHLYAAGRPERELVTAAVGFAGAVASVRSAAEARFTREAAATLRVYLISDRTVVNGRVLRDSPVPDPLAGATVHQEGDRATIEFGESPTEDVLMLRIDGVWKLAIFDTLVVPGRPEAATLTSAFTDAAQRLAALAQDVPEGGYRSIDDVQLAMAMAVRPE